MRSQCESVLDICKCAPPIFTPRSRFSISSRNNWTVTFTREDFTPVQIDVQNEATPDKPFELADLKQWKKQLFTAKMIVLNVRTDLKGVTTLQKDDISAMFKATNRKKKMHVVLMLSGKGSTAELPLELLNIDWLEMTSDGTWTGSRIYTTEYNPDAVFGTFEYLHVDEMSPQCFDDSYTDNEFTALWIENRPALITSEVQPEFLKVKIAQVQHIDKLYGFLFNNRYKVVDIIMNDDILPVAPEDKLSFMDKLRGAERPQEEKLFGKVVDVVGTFLEQFHGYFAIHDTDGKHDGNRLELDGLKFIGNFQDFVDFHNLPGNMEDVTLRLSDAYAGKTQLQVFAEWLKGCDRMVHLVINERVDLLKMTIELMQVESVTWVSLETLKATLRDDPQSLVFLFGLPAAQVLTYGFSRMKNSHAMEEKATEANWRQHDHKRHENKNYVEYRHTERYKEEQLQPPNTPTGGTQNP